VVTVVWMGTPPSSCDVCKAPLVDEFYDAKTTHGPWGNLCAGCFKTIGIGLGLGRGQHYVKNADGEFAKTEG